jgi:hydrogenase nickel incorporation protein HypB
MSVTEGEDKPLKYPTIFNTADAAVITKMDLASAAEFNLELACANIECVRPGMPIFSVSSKAGAGINELLESLKTLSSSASQKQMRPA